MNQTSLQNGGITVPGAPQSAFPSTLPIFTVTGFQQIGPTTAANTNFTTSVTEFLDTFSMVRGRHTFKFGTDLRREALDILNPPNPTGSYAFTTTGTDSSTGASGNALASLLLGQVNAFSIDIQNQALQERAHIAEFFVGDDWKVSDRLTLNIGTRYTLNFPVHRSAQSDAPSSTSTRRCWTFRTPRANLECCDFGPRVGLAYRLGDSWVIRSGYGMVWFEQTGITTPFTLPQFPFVQTVGQQSQDNINPAFLLSSGPTVQVTAPNPNSGLGQGVFGVDRNVGSGYSQQWNFTVQKTFWQEPQPRGRLPRLEEHAPRLARIEPQPAAGRRPGAGLGADRQSAESLFRTDPRVVVARPAHHRAAAVAARLSRASPTWRSSATTSADSEYEAFQVKLEKRFSRGLTFTFAYTFSKLIDDASTYFSQTIFTGPTLDHHRRRRRLQSQAGDAMFRAAISRASFPPAGCIRFRDCGRSPAGRSAAWCASRRATRCR